MAEVLQSADGQSAAERDGQAAPRSEQLLADGATPLVGSHLYTRRDYWDARFETEDVKEWLCAFKDIRGLLEELLPEDRDAKILLVGCGNSELGADLARELGCTNVIASDYSETCVARMAKKHAAVAGLRYAYADMLDLGATFAAGAFDVVLDKAGFDAVVADGGGDRWTPTDAAVAAAEKLAASVAHVLRDGGRFLQITFSQPHFRRPLLLAGGAASPWARCETRAVDVGFGYACFALDKRRPGDAAAAAPEARPADAARRRAPSASSDDEADVAAAFMAAGLSSDDEA